MHLKYGNINDAFHGMVAGFHTGAIQTNTTHSRNGEVMMIEEPVIVTYNKPRERVLFNQERDCNPFFHLYESLWMLAGRNDIKALARYNSQMINYSDDGETQNGAYGYRWRNSKPRIEMTNPEWYENRMVGEDQLQIIIEHLKAKPESRRVVLQMWNVEDDLLKIDSSKDVCCNLSAMFSIENGDCVACLGTGTQYTDVEEMNPIECSQCGGFPHDVPKSLNMTVTNRSNDLVWGMLGANVVHFSFLQEYIACALGLDVGVYNQISNNLHAYSDKWEPEKWLDFDPIVPLTYSNFSVGPKLFDDGNWEEFDRANKALVEAYSKNYVCDIVNGSSEWKDFPFLANTVEPLLNAFGWHKLRNYKAALSFCYHIESEDWSIAATSWIKKRMKNWEKNNV